MTHWRPALVEVTRRGRVPLVRGPSMPIDILRVEIDAQADEHSINHLTSGATALALVVAAGDDAMHPLVHGVVRSLRARGAAVGLVVLETHVGSIDARLELSRSIDGAVLSAQPDAPVAVALLGGMVLPGLIGYSGRELRELLAAPCAGVVHEIDHRSETVTGHVRESLRSARLKAAHLAVICSVDTGLDDIQRSFRACANAMRPGRDLVGCAFSCASTTGTQAFVTAFMRREVFAQRLHQAYPNDV